MKHEDGTENDRKRKQGESPDIEELDDHELERVAGGIGAPRSHRGKKASLFEERRLSSLDGKGNDVLTEE